MPGIEFLSLYRHIIVLGQKRSEITSLHFLKLHFTRLSCVNNGIIITQRSQESDTKTNLNQNYHDEEDENQVTIKNLQLPSV